MGELGGSVTETGMEWCPCGRLAVNDEGAKMNWGWIKVEGLARVGREGLRPEIGFWEGVVSWDRAMSWELRVRLAAVSPGLSLEAMSL